MHSPRTPWRTAHPRFDAIICDVDGCLSAEDGAAFDLAALAQIADHNRLARLHRDRPLVTLCTGRPEPFAEAMTRLIANTTLPIVCENGVWLFDPAANLYLRDPAISPDHRRMIRDAAEWLDNTYSPAGVTQQPGKSCSVSLYHPDTPYLTSLCEPIRAEFARRGWHMRVSMTWLYINCDLAHVSKGTGLSRLCRHAGLAADRLAGIGDTMSDLPIRQGVRTFACPANASADIKQHADLIAHASEAAGTLELINRLSAMTQ